MGDTHLAFAYNFIGAIFYNAWDGHQYLCTGTLIAPTLVLTAGHCGCGITGSYWINFHQDARRERTSIAAVDGPPILYDRDICRTGFLGGGRDMALLRLRNPFQPAKTTGTADKPLQLQPFRDPPELIWDLRAKLPKGLPLTAVGYGYSNAGTTQVRLQGDIPIVSATCEERAFNSTCSAFNEMILAEKPSGTGLRTDTCGGDSGGPVFLVEPDKEEPNLIAITSRAAPGRHDNASLHCGGGGIYALIGRKSVHAWLLANGVKRAKDQ